MDPLYLAYALPLGLVWGAYLVLTKRSERKSRTTLSENEAAGLGAPSSLHPVIDNAKCIGCGSCTRACPEGDVLGLIRGHATLVEPTLCLGHGACRAACPVGAITLVLGSAERGVEIPHVKANFETNVEGIFVAGELGGMGLVRNAMEQGKQAVASIAQRGRSADSRMLDLFIVGAGPAGIAASLSAADSGLRYLTIEQDELGGTVAHYPRRKLVMTAPVKLPLVGTFQFREVSKEKLLGFWRHAAHRGRLAIQTSERLEAVTAVDGGFLVQTTRGHYAARSVLLAIGRRGTPRKLGVSGEDLAKVTYRLVDASQYRGQHVLVVGGGDSALEAAASLAEAGAASVTLSYRSPAFSRAKPKNRRRVEQAIAEGQIAALMPSQVLAIESDRVVIEQSGTASAFANDAVIVCAGGVLPTQLLKDIGIETEIKHGTP